MDLDPQRRSAVRETNVQRLGRFRLHLGGGLETKNAVNEVDLETNVLQIRGLGDGLWHENGTKTARMLDIGKLLHLCVLKVGRAWGL